MSKKKKGLPKRTKEDTDHAVARAFFGAIPVVGPAAVEALNAFVAPPLARRREAWMTDVVERLQTLEEEGIDVAALRDNDEFISILMHASQFALRTHQAEKLAALRNAVINVARGHAPEATLEQIFLNHVNDLTALHLKILKFFEAPTIPTGVTQGKLGPIIEATILGLRGQRALCDQIGRDLYSRGLIAIDEFQTQRTRSELSRKRTTNLGDGFLRFIEESK